MPSHAEFIATICKHPADMFPRGVYADWLEERGDVRGEFIRKSIELTGYSPPRGIKKRPVGMFGDKLKPQFHKHGKRSAWGKDRVKSERRCAALLAEHRAAWTMAGLPEDKFSCNDERWAKAILSQWSMDYGFFPNQNNGIAMIGVKFARGFPEVLMLRFEEWQRHYETLIDAMPVREVRLTNRGNVGFVDLAIAQNRDIGDAFDDEPIIDLLVTAFPGHDRERPIKYTLPAVTQPTGTNRTERPRTAEPIAR